MRNIVVGGRIDERDIRMDAGTAAVIIFGLKTFGKPAADVAADFAKRALGPFGDAAGKALASPIEQFNERRARRFQQILAKTADALSEIEPQPVPDYLALPLIQHGTLVDDEDLQAIWAQLIASASSGSAECAVWPSFPQILSELSPLEARILGHLYEVILSRYRGEYDYTELEIGSFVELHGGSTQDARLVQDNFIRLQLLRRHPVMRGDEIGKVVAKLIESRGSASLGDVELEDNRFGSYKVTALGWAFLKACAGPRPKASSAQDSPDNSS
jgi:hypothetical protein